MLPYINTPFDYVAGLLGASTDELKLIFTFLISYPLAALLKNLGDDKPRSKNIFSISIAVFFLVGLFDLWSGLLLLVVDSTVIYLIAAYVEGPLMPWIGFTFLMGHMSVSHIYRQLANSPSSVDITGAQMVQVMKLSAFCWNVWDGKQKQDGLDDVQKERALKKMPGLLNYAGFVAFFPAIMVGPAFDYAEYERWLNLSMFELPAGTDPIKALPTRKKRKVPRSATPAVLKMLTGLAWLFAFLQLSNYHYPGLLLTDKYRDMNFLWRIYHLHMVNFTARTKYYAVWSLTEGGCIMAGIGFKGIDPKTGRADWGRLTNIKPLGVELAQNSHAYLGNWNLNTNHWLRNYVYLRVTPKGKKPGFRASMATFLTSAFWHGFYPGYYLTFMLGSFIQTIAKNGRRLLRPFFFTPDGKKALPRKRYYDVLTWLATQLAFTFATTPFLILTIGDSLLVWSRVYFYCIVGIAAGGLFLFSPGKPWLSKKVKAYSSRPELSRGKSQENLQGATLGVPDDMGKEWDELVDEIAEEVKKRRAGEPGLDGEDLRKAVEETLLKTREGIELRMRKTAEATKAQ